MSDNYLSVGVLAIDIERANPKANMRMVRDYVSRYGNELDVLVLPELFTTAFARDIEELRYVAEDDNGPTVSELKTISAQYDIAIGGSYLAKIGDAYYNRGFIILPDGNEMFYNKRHLFGLSAESQLFTSGIELPGIVEYKGWRITLVVCYDLRFPVWCRRRENHFNYDVLLVVANWPVSRAYAWKHLLMARAIENQAVVIGADRSGHDDFGSYGDMTHIYDCAGQEADYVCHSQLVIAKLSHNNLLEMRRHWPFAGDADSFRIL